MEKKFKYLPVLAFLGLFFYTMHQIYIGNKQPCACVVQYENDFLFNEFLMLLLALNMFIHTKRKYNKIALNGIILTCLLNVIAILTPLNFSLYNSLLTQIILTFMIMLMIYRIIRQK